MDRKKKLRLYQVLFFSIGLSIILFTYYQKDFSDKEKIISKNLQEKIDKQTKNKDYNDSNIFYNVEYSGLDLEKNRYTISSEEAINSDVNPNLVIMSRVLAKFYFKDNTVLTISSLEANYNNKTLDMEFRRNVKAFYENSELYAEKAQFLNSKNSLVVTDKVKVIDAMETIFEDKLIFDIKSKTLNITSLKNNMVKSKII